MEGVSVQVEGNQRSNRCSVRQDIGDGHFRGWIREIKLMISLID